MQVTKLRVKANGLVPAGRFFAQLAAKLEDANFETALREAELEDEDRALEAAYRKHSPSRSGLAEREQHVAMM